MSVVLEESPDGSKMCGEVQGGKLTLYVEPVKGGVETHIANLTLDATKRLLQLLTKENDDSRRELGPHTTT